jgi:hypothetical protein
MTERSDEDNGICRATEPMRLADEISPMRMEIIAGQKPETFSVLLAQSLACEGAD